jgi:L-2-hydroxyglutarate oxidase LhgO
MDADITIIGAGVIGLSIASEMADSKQNIYILEKNRSHGMGISSRNSEVIHAGIYYPQDSLKARLCMEGRERLYEICANNNIPFKKMGKLIIANTKDEMAQIERLLRNAEHNGVPASLIDQDQIKIVEPNIRAFGALYSPETGIFSVHALMDYYLHEAKRGGAEIAYETEVKEIKAVSGGYKITTMGADGEPYDFLSEKVVNAAGLNSDTIAGMIGKSYRHHYCKGNYFRIADSKNGMVRRLIYPVPEEKHVGLGVHLTMDLGGRMKLGPDTAYIERTEDYRVDAARGDAFFEAAVKFLPFIKREDIFPDMSGIRPKLQGPGEDFRDFVISEDLPGFINLVGIESPGLTAAPAIARYVRGVLAGKLAYV